MLYWLQYNQCLSDIRFIGIKGGPFMHIRVPFLAVLVISIFQLAVYGIQNNEYSKKDFDEIFILQLDDITELSMTNLSGQRRSTKDPEQILSFLNYFDQFQYQRLMDDQTAFMPKRVFSISFYAGDEVEFIIPYGNEALVTHKVYSVKSGEIEQEKLLEMFLSLPNHKENPADSP